MLLPLCTVYISHVFVAISVFIVRFAYSLVNDDEDIDEEEPEQGPNKNFGTFMSHYLCYERAFDENQPAAPYNSGQTPLYVSLTLVFG